MANSTISCNSGSYSIVGAAAFAAWVLGVTSGSYAVTGSTINPVHGYRVTAVSGVYTLTGTPVSINRLTAAPAGYILNGSTVTLRYSAGSKTVTATSGSYAITGITATKLEYTKQFIKGQYTLIGTVANLLRSLGPRLAVSSGSYSISGSPVGLLSTVTIGSGDYQVTGGNTILRTGKSLPIGSGVYTLSNNTITRLEQLRHFPSLSGSYAITGAITTLRYSNSKAIFIVIDNGLYTFTGTPTNLLMVRRLVATGGTYTISDGHTVFRKQYDTGNYLLTGSIVNFLRSNRQLTATSGIYLITGQATSLIYSVHRLVLDNGSYSISGPITTIKATRVLTGQVGSYGWVGSPVTLRATRVMVDPGVYSLTGSPVTLRASRTGRWRKQSRQPAIATPQPVVAATWDPQQGAAGV